MKDDFIIEKGLLEIENQYLYDALRDILQIGKRDLSNPKYDSYFTVASNAIRFYEERREFPNVSKKHRFC